MIIQDRIYFGADWSGTGHIYSCTFTGDDLKQHTDHKQFNGRVPQTDGTEALTIATHSGMKGKLLCFKLEVQSILLI